MHITGDALSHVPCPHRKFPSFVQVLIIQWMLSRVLIMHSEWIWLGGCSKLSESVKLTLMGTELPKNWYGDEC